MSCIANFYLDGVRYSLEDYDMNTHTTQKLLQKVLSSAKSNMEKAASIAPNENQGFKGTEKDELAHADIMDHNDMLRQLNLKTGQQLSEHDDEEMLKDL